MLSLDEAIRKYEATEEEYKHTPHIKGGLVDMVAEEHRQLAEWLKDYKRLKEKEEPKMVIYTADGYADGQLVYDMAECPNCGMNFEEADQFWETEYCLKCGQALKWEVEE